MSEAFFKELHERYGDKRLFIKRLRDRMSLHEKSQGALARRSGFQPSDVSRWLNYHVKPDMDTMRILDEALEALIRGE